MCTETNEKCPLHLGNAPSYMRSTRTCKQSQRRAVNTMARTGERGGTGLEGSLPGTGSGGPRRLAWLRGGDSGALKALADLGAGTPAQRCLYIVSLGDSWMPPQGLCTRHARSLSFLSCSDTGLPLRSQLRPCPPPAYHSLPLTCSQSPIDTWQASSQLRLHLIVSA